MRRIPLVLIWTALPVGLAYGAPGEQSFTPTQVLVPIREVGLTNATADWPLYTCTFGTEAGCLVDITDESALGALFTQQPETELTDGTYDRLYVSTCNTEGLYHAQLTGSVSIDGTTYYTQSGTDPLTTTEASLSPVTVEFHGCRRTYLLATPVTVTDGSPDSPVSVNLYIALNSIAWARLGPTMVPGSCTQDPAGTHSVCMAYPDVVPYVGTPGAVSLERYVIIENPGDPYTYGGLVLLVVDEADNVIAGVTRRVFTPRSQPPTVPFDTPMKTITPDGGGNYELESYGSTATGTGYARFTAFRREDHSGTYLVAGGSSVPYYAYRDVAAELPACADGGPVFDAYPMDYDLGPPLQIPDLTALFPLGNLNPTGGHVLPVDHMYFGLRYVEPGNPEGEVVSTPLYFPVAGRITRLTHKRMWYSVPPADPTPDVVEYAIEYAPCSEVAITFDHVSSLSPAVGDALTDAEAGGGGRCDSYSTGGRSFESCTYSMKAEFASGARVGTVGGIPGNNAWDFGVQDARVPPIAYANPSRYGVHPSGLDVFHAACPLEYYEASMRDTLKTFLGDGTTPMDPPSCGTIEQDVPGTAQGNWFHPGSPTDPEDPHLALVHDNVLPGLGAFSVGNTVANLAAATYLFEPTTSGRTNLDFNLVAPGPTVYCYESLRRYRDQPLMSDTLILIQLATSTELRIEGRSAADCAALGPEMTWSLSSSASSFER